jgi:hypothetical protein
VTPGGPPSPLPGVAAPGTSGLAHEGAILLLGAMGMSVAAAPSPQAGPAGATSADAQEPCALEGLQLVSWVPRVSPEHLFLLPVAQATYPKHAGS